ncbi:uncharacterized protein AAES06_017169 isoform 1-T2 [Glossophaga mutica]
MLPYLYYPRSLTSSTPSPVLPNFPSNLCKACGGENICTKSEGARQGVPVRVVKPVPTPGGLHVGWPLEEGVSEARGAEGSGQMSSGVTGTWFPKMERKFGGELGSIDGSSKRRLKPFAAGVETKKCQKLYLLKNRGDSLKGETFHL